MKRINARPAVAIKENASDEELTLSVVIFGGEDDSKEHALSLVSSDSVESLKRRIMDILKTNDVNVALLTKDGARVERGSLQDNGCVNGTRLQGLIVPKEVGQAVRKQPSNYLKVDPQNPFLSKAEAQSDKKRSPVCSWMPYCCSTPPSQSVNESALREDSLAQVTADGAYDFPSAEPETEESPDSSDSSSLTLLKAKGFRST